jgi:hypothetical protein
VSARLAGGLPESVPPVPSTVSLSSTSTHPGTFTTMVKPVSPSMGSESGGEKKKSPNVGAIAGGAIGGSAVLAAIGVGAWMFFRRRAATRNDGGDSDYTRVSTVGRLSEQGTPPTQLRLYVSCLLPSPACILMGFHRIHMTHPPTLAALPTRQMGHTRPHPTRANTPVPRSREQSDSVLFFLRFLTRFFS